jgi:hypothetical protein
MVYEQELLALRKEAEFSEPGTVLFVGARRTPPSEIVTDGVSARVGQQSRTGAQA